MPDLQDYTNNELQEEIARRLKAMQDEWKDKARCVVCGLKYFESNHYDCDDYDFPSDIPRPGHHLECQGDHYYWSLHDSFQCGDQKDYCFPHIKTMCKYCRYVVKVQKLEQDPEKPHY